MVIPDFFAAMTSVFSSYFQQAPDDSPGGSCHRRETRLPRPESALEIFFSTDNRRFISNRTSKMRCEISLQTIEDRFLAIVASPAVSYAQDTVTLLSKIIIMRCRCSQDLSIAKWHMLSIWYFINIIFPGSMWWLAGNLFDNKDTIRILLRHISFILHIFFV